MQTVYDTAPPASYALESTDEDESDDSGAINRSTGRDPGDAEVTLVGCETVAHGSQVVFLVGEAGERIAEGFVSRAITDTSQGQILVNGQQVRRLDPIIQVKLPANLVTAH